jgi:hypothetical protein
MVNYVVFEFLVKVGSSIGWGVFYDDNCHDDRTEQLCLVFVIFNKTIIDGLFVVQPEGGFAPIVLLQPYGTNNENEHEILEHVLTFVIVRSNESIDRT